MEPLWVAAQALLAVIVGLVVWKLAAAMVARTKRRGKTLPGPPRHWLLGSVPQVAKVIKAGHHLDALVIQLSHEYGKIFALDLLAFELVAVLDPDAVKEVIITKAYPKSPSYDGLFPFIGKESLLVAEETLWHRQRKAFTPAFSYAFLRTMVPAFMDKGRTLMGRLQRSAEAQETVKILDVLVLATMEIICQVAMNKNYAFLESATPPVFLQYFRELLNSCLYYTNSPHMKWMQWLPWNAIHVRRLQRRYNGLILDVVRERLADGAAGKKAAAALRAAGAKAINVTASSSAAAIGNNGGGSDGVKGGSDKEQGEEQDNELAALAAETGPKDILAMAIQTAQEDGDGALNELEILAQVKTFLFAGHDTTASTLAFAVYELSQHPEMEAKLVAEIKAVGAWQRALEGTLTSEDLNAFKYMGLVVKEVLRMWPPGGTVRMAPAGSTLQGFDIGQKVLYIPHYVLHRDTDLWGKTAAQFSPERWQDEAYVAGLHPQAYQPFSKGPRDCIGQTFALLEAKALLAMMYARFTFKYMGEKPEEQGYQITSFPKYHVPVQIIVRAP